MKNAFKTKKILNPILIFLASGDKKKSRKSWKRQLTFQFYKGKKKYKSNRNTRDNASKHHYSIPITEPKSLALPVFL